MFKKIVTGCVVFSGLCAICTLGRFAFTEASDSSTPAYVNLLNTQYYGTVSVDEDLNNALFVYDSDSDESFQIQGTWKEDGFQGDCLITYEDGRTMNVKFKKNIAAGDITIHNTDGSSETLSCASGTPYKQHQYLDASGNLVALDWYYQGTLDQVWEESAISPSYESLTETPNEYLDLSLEISGTVTDIYEMTRYSYMKVRDDDGNLYLCQYINLRIDKYAPAQSPNLSVGDQVTVCGKFTGMTDPEEDQPNLFEHLLGYEQDFATFKNSIVDSSFWSSNLSYSKVEDQELDQALPLLAVVSCNTDEDAAPDPLNLAYTYEEICNYPFYYMDTAAEFTGTVLYETYDSDIPRATLLIQVEDTDDIYAITWETDTYISLLDKKVVCTGYHNGNNKIPYYNTETGHLGYALYPNITADNIKEPD